MCDINSLIICTFFFSSDWAQQIFTPLSSTTYIVSVNSIRDKLMIVTILIRYKSWQSEIKIFSTFSLFCSFNFILFHFLYSFGAFSFSHYAHKLRWNLSFILHTSTSRWVFAKYFLFIRKIYVSYERSRLQYFFWYIYFILYGDSHYLYLYFILLRDFFLRSRVCCWIHLKTFSIVAETFF